MLYKIIVYINKLQHNIFICGLIKIAALFHLDKANYYWLLPEAYVKILYLMN